MLGTLVLATFAETKVARLPGRTPVSLMNFIRVTKSFKVETQWR
jgi:hypothetical protein